LPVSLIRVIPGWLFGGCFFFILVLNDWAHHLMLLVVAPPEVFCLEASYRSGSGILAIASPKGGFRFSRFGNDHIDSLTRGSGVGWNTTLITHYCSRLLGGCDMFQEVSQALAYFSFQMLFH